MRISDWSSDVCSSDLLLLSKVSAVGGMAGLGAYNHYRLIPALRKGKRRAALRQMRTSLALEVVCLVAVVAITAVLVVVTPARSEMSPGVVEKMVEIGDIGSIQVTVAPAARSEEHTSELQSLMR